MEDYKQEIKELILRYYSAEDMGEKIYKTTQEILQMCQGVIPHQPITQHDIYEVMKEMGFEIEKQETEYGECFFWVLYENPSSHTTKITP